MSRLKSFAFFYLEGLSEFSFSVSNLNVSMRLSCLVFWCHCNAFIVRAVSTLEAPAPLLTHKGSSIFFGMEKLCSCSDLRSIREFPILRLCIYINISISPTSSGASIREAVLYQCRYETSSNPTRLSFSCSMQRALNYSGWLF